MSQQVARVKHQAPNFSGVAYSNKDFVNIELSTLLKEGKWVVLFFWPLDFTFVCPTEIKAFSERHEKFTAAGVNLVGCSVDSQFSHHAWCTSTAKGALGPVNFPMLSDIGGKIAKQYGCLIE
jgi:peroxiredoxin (alkyl hydroperoxide reductase subunit C)